LCKISVTYCGLRFNSDDTDTYITVFTVDELLDSLAKSSDSGLFILGYYIAE